jgi:hypothetical protein
MLDQMFTAENFRRIYDAENRKGHDLERFSTVMNRFEIPNRADF